MTTYEMVALADEDGKTYQIGDMYYQKDMGFHDKDNCEWNAGAFHFRGGLNGFIHLSNWAEAPIRYTDAQLVKLIGYDFEYVGR